MKDKGTITVEQVKEARRLTEEADAAADAAMQVWDRASEAAAVASKAYWDLRNHYMIQEGM